MKKVVFINDLRFPSGDAGSIRVLNTAKAMRENGEEVLVVSHGERNSSIKKGNVEGVDYILFNSTNRYVDIFSFVLKIIIWVVCNRKAIKAIVGYGSNTILVGILKMLCGLCKMTFVCDVVEWYSKEQFSSRYSFAYFQKNIQNKYILNKKVRIIAISSYLEKYYKEKGCKTVRIPIFFDVNVPSIKKTEHNKLTFMYAGSPGKKDYLYNMLEGISLLCAEDKNKICFIIAGASEQQVKSNIPEDKFNRINDILTIKGRISREEVIDSFKNVDFAVLLRNPDLRVSKAGFPTKVVESMLYKTPMVCNYSSDLSKYLFDGNNSIICKDCTPDAFKDALLRCLQLKKHDIERLSENAYQTVKEKLSIDAVKKQLSYILK